MEWRPTVQMVLEVRFRYSTCIAKAYLNEESGLVRRASNETTTSRSASASSVSPCTTTVTSVLGQHLDATKGECQTVTIVSTPEVKSTSMTSTETSLKPTTSAILTSS